jgi:hypothetical protein
LPTWLCNHPPRPRARRRRWHEASEWNTF